jgi:hypothetical protein
MLPPVRRDDADPSLKDSASVGDSDTQQETLPVKHQWHSYKEEEEFKALVLQLGAIVNKDPYIHSQVALSAAGSLRFLFLKQCACQNFGRCREIWQQLDDRDRRNFIRDASVRTSEHFFLNIMEPDDSTRASDSSCSSSCASEFDVPKET